MISTLLAQYAWVARIGFAAVLIATPFVARWLHTRRRVAGVLLCLAAALIVFTTLIPDPTRIVAGCELPFAFTDLIRVDSLANILLFVPLTLAMTVLTRRRLLAFAVGTGASAAIELAQWLAPTLGRSCTSTDWIANTLGAALGVGLASLGLLSTRVASSRTGSPRRTRRA